MKLNAALIKISLPQNKSFLRFKLIKRLVRSTILKGLMSKDVVVDTNILFIFFKEILR